MTRMLPMFALLLVVGVSSCAKSDSPYLSTLIGKPCKVQFRRDTLGGSASLPISATTDVVNGAEVSLRGTLRSVEEQGIVLVAGKETFWIPRDTILLVVAASDLK